MTVLVQDELGYAVWNNVKRFVVQGPTVLFTFADGEERKIDAMVVECRMDEESV